MEIEPGFYRDISNDDYHNGPGLSKSFMFNLLRSPAHAVTPTKETPALFDGECFHTSIFEPVRWSKEYERKPDGMNFATKEGKAWKAEAIAQGQKIVTPDKWDAFQAMAKAVYEHPLASELLSDGEAEVSAYCQDHDNPDILLKGRFDWLNKKKGIIVDAKSTTDARPHNIIRDAHKYGWHMQAFVYLYIATQITKKIHDEFYFIAVEKDEPWGVNVFSASEEFINYGGKLTYQAIEIYKECQSKALWPGYPIDINVLELPVWVKRDRAIFD